MNSVTYSLRRFTGQHKRTLLIVSSIVILSYIYYLSYYTYRFPIRTDEGHLVSSTLRVLNGQIPVKDFKQAYAPGRYWLLALLFNFFEPSLAVERLMFICVMTMINVLMYFAAKRSVSMWFIAIPLLMVSLIPGVWNKAFINFLLLLNILMIYRYLDRFDRRSLLLCGIVVGLSVYIRQDIAGYAALTFLLCVFFHHIRSTRDLGERIEKRRLLISRSTISDSTIFSLVVFDIMVDSYRDASKVLIGVDGDNPLTIPIRLP